MPDCGNMTTDTVRRAPPEDCNSMCTGDSSENCGSSDSLSLYWNGLPLLPYPTFVQNVGAWVILACYK
jgi:hypothetical protein